MFYADPPKPERRPAGRPFRHGARFSCKDPSTWPEPTAEHRASSRDYGEVRVRAWSGLHPKTRKAAERYGSESAAVVEGTVVLVEVGRLPRGERRRKPKALWLWWRGPDRPDLDLLWRAYCRRFDVEHFVGYVESEDRYLIGYSGGGRGGDSHSPLRPRLQAEGEGSAMKIIYRRESDTIRITLKPDVRYAESEEVAPGVVVDFDEAGNAISLEVYDSASEKVDLSKLEVEGILEYPKAQAPS